MVVTVHLCVFNLLCFANIFNISILYKDICMKVEEINLSEKCFPFGVFNSSCREQVSILS